MHMRMNMHTPMPMHMHVHMHMHMCSLFVSPPRHSAMQASKYTTFGAVTYSRRHTESMLAGLDLSGLGPRPETAEDYKVRVLVMWRTDTVARSLGCVVWCVCACECECVCVRAHAYFIWMLEAGKTALRLLHFPRLRLRIS
jgi:hypothetical protein